jgi:hypothetical protein
MDWSSFTDGAKRDSGKIYEESHVTSWRIDTSNGYSVAVPQGESAYIEKLRCVDI